MVNSQRGGIFQCCSLLYSMFLTFNFYYTTVTNDTPRISAPMVHSSMKNDTADQMCYSWRGKRSPLPVAGVDVSLCLPFPFWTISLLLACGSADGACAWADAAWSSRVALSCRVPISTTTARHWKRKKEKTSWAQLNIPLACFIATDAAELSFGTLVLRSRCLWLPSESCKGHFYRCYLTPPAFFCLSASSLWPKLNWFHSSNLNRVRRRVLYTGSAAPTWYF